MFGNSTRQQLFGVDCLPTVSKQKNCQKLGSAWCRLFVSCLYFVKSPQPSGPLAMFLFLFSKAKQVTKNSNSLSTKDIVFQTVRLEETNNGNHLVIRQATPEAEGVSSKN